MADEQAKAQWSEVEFQGKMIVDINGHKIGKFQDVDVDVDVETDIPQFVTVKEGIIGRHLTFVPLGGIQIGPDDLQVAVTKEQVESAPNIAIQGGELSQSEESILYHHFELNYTPIEDALEGGVTQVAGPILPGHRPQKGSHNAHREPRTGALQRAPPRSLSYPCLGWIMVAALMAQARRGDNG